MRRPAKRTGSRPASSPTIVEASELGLFTTLARTGLFLDALQRECLGSHELNFSEYSVLRLLQKAESHRLTPSQLAEAVICTTGAMTKLVDRLQRRAFVERKPSPSDRRGVLVELTSSGHKTANDAAETYRIGRERVLTELGKDESGAIHRHLTRLLDAFESERKNATEASQRAS